MMTITSTPITFHVPCDLSYDTRYIYIATAAAATTTTTARMRFPYDHASRIFFLYLFHDHLYLLYVFVCVVCFILFVYFPHFIVRILLIGMIISPSECTMNFDRFLFFEK